MVRAVATGVVCAWSLAATYLLAVWTTAGQRFEDAVLRGADLASGGVQEIVASRTLDKISEFTLAGAVVVVFAIGLLRRRPALAVAGAGVIVASVVTTVILRNEVLPRPMLLDSGYRRHDHSFPSGHTAIAMAVMCGLALVVPYRLRGVAVFLTSVWAAAVGAATVTASWHRPSDTIGSDLIVLIYTCAAIALLARGGSARRAEPCTVAGRTALGVLAGLYVVEALIAAGVAVTIGGAMVLGALRDDAAAFTAGRAVTLAGSALVPLALLWLLRHVDLATRPATSGYLTGTRNTF